MMTTYSSTCNKSEHQRLDNTTHRRELVDVQPPTEVGGNQRSFRSSTGGNACSTHCRSPAECEAQFLYVSGESITLGSKNCSNGITSRGSYQSHSKPPKAGTDDPVNYYLPPPSPAPNSDRYIMEVMSPQSIQAACFDKYTSYYDSRCSTNRQVGNFNAHQQSPHQSLRHQPQATQIYSATSISPLDANGTCASNYNESYVSSLKQCSMKQSSRFRVSDRFREVPASNLLILNSPSSIVSSEHIYATTTDESSVPPVRYIPSANYLTQNPPFLTRDTYTYLRSTVHTPVKRYIPTPPNELSADITMQTSKPTQLMPKKCAYGGGNSNTSLVSNCQGLHNKSRYMNTIPNRLRVKCCKDGSTNTNTSRPQAGTKNNSHLTHTLEHRSIVAAEYSGTSTRPCTKNSHNNNITGNTTSNTSGSINLKSTAGRDSSLIIVHNQQLPNSNNLAAINGQNSSCFLSSTTSLGVCPSPFSVPSLSLSETPVSSAANNNNESQRILDSSHSNATISGIYANNINGLTNDYLKRTPSYEYENTTVVSVTSDGRNCSAPASKMERAISNNNAISYNSIATANSGLATTCMHCNTVRRTTGVHQTTQTTDPISPTPLQQAAGDMSLIGLGVCKSNFAQSSADESTFASTPSISESHSSPLPSSNGVVHNDGCGLTIFPSKIDENNSSTFVIDQMQQQKQTEQTFVTAHKSHQQKKTIIRQSTITEKLEVVGNSLCSQSVSSECHLLQASPLQPSHQQKQSINKCQQQQSFPIQELRVQEREEQQENVQDYSQRTHLARYIQKEISRFFGVDVSTEAEQVVIWQGRQRRLALRRFGALRSENELHSEMTNIRNHNGGHNHMYCYDAGGSTSQQFHQHHHSSERPDILPDHDTERGDLKSLQCSTNQSNFLFTDFHVGGDIERKVSVASMIVSSVTFVLRMLNKQEQTSIQRNVSRRFTPTDINNFMNVKNREEIVEGISTVQENDMYLASNGTDQASDNTKPNRRNNNVIDINIPKSLAPETNIKRDQSGSALIGNKGVKIMEHHRQIYISERVHGWRTSAVMDTNTRTTTIMSGQQQPPSNNSERKVFGSSTCSSDHSNNATNLDGYVTPTLSNGSSTKGTMGNRISAELIGSVLDKSHHQSKVGLFSLNDLDDRDDHRPFFTYWINTVQTLVLLLSVICYGIGPIGIGIEKKTGQVLVNSLSLQTVQHTEQRNIWIGPSSNDLVHLGAKFATCMRSDVRVMDVILKTRRQERETACCIRNDDSGCVQSSQTDCSLRGLFPAKSISTWKKWSAGESGPGGRISGSVCGLDPKYCDTPASISPHEWPDDITKWPICRKTNSFSQRFRYKDHTAEHMVCEVIAHPCCTGVYGECRITTREYCDFVNGYFHEEASLCSQTHCLVYVMQLQ